MLVLTRKVGESIVIADVVVLTVQKIKGNQIQLTFDAPGDIEILRKELYDRKHPDQKNNLTSKVK
jgi:carbon storage regulator